jgi:hypothetical protein
LVNQQHLLDLLQHLSYGIESSSSAVEGEKILNINELASRLNVSEDKLSRLLSSKNMTAEQVDNPAKEAQIARELNSGLATPTQSQPPAKPAQAPGGGLVKPPAPAANAGLATREQKSFNGRTVESVRNEQEAASFDMFAVPIESATRVMKRGIELAVAPEGKLTPEEEQEAKEMAEHIKQARRNVVGKLLDDSSMWSGKVAERSAAAFNLDDMGTTIEVSAM